MSDPESNYAAWIEKSEDDLLCIENNLAAERVPWDAVCFHAQQAAEKLLKAFLVHRGRLPNKTHDLVALLTECTELDPDLVVLEADCKQLTVHAVAPRYPEAFYRPIEAEARRVVEAARRVRSALLARLPGPEGG